MEGISGHPQTLRSPGWRMGAHTLVLSTTPLLQTSFWSTGLRRLGGEGQGTGIAQQIMRGEEVCERGLGG